MDKRVRGSWALGGQSEVDLDYHEILTAGLSVQQGIVRQRIIPVYVVSDLEGICQHIIQAFEAGVDFQDNADSFLLLLCLHHAYQGDHRLFLKSDAVQYLEGHGFRFEVREKENVHRLDELLPNVTGGKNLRRTLAAMPEEETTEANAGQFLSFASLFLPKLVVGEKACLEKVQRQIQVHAEQGLIQYPTSWQSVGHMMVIFRLMRTNFLIKFLLIHQGMHMVAGHDANDTVISNSVAQARFSGLLIVKTVLDHILQKTDLGVRLHPLARTAKVKNEVSSFKAALGSLAKHGEYAPFARLLNLSGVNNLEHGLYPQLSAIALGVATAHGSTLAGVNVGEQYQQLREAATEAEKQLQQYAETRELDNLGLDEQEKKILMSFHQKKNEISFQQTNAMVTLRKERLAKLTEAITTASKIKVGDRYPDDNDIPFPGPIYDETHPNPSDDNPDDSRDTTIPGGVVDPYDDESNNYPDYEDSAEGTTGDLDLFNLDDDDDDSQPGPPDRGQSKERAARTHGLQDPTLDGAKKVPELTPGSHQPGNLHITKPGLNTNQPQGNMSSTLQSMTPIQEESEPDDQKDDDDESLTSLDSEGDEDVESVSGENNPTVAPPAPVYKDTGVDTNQQNGPSNAVDGQGSESEALPINPEKRSALEETYYHLLKTQGPFEAINYYHLMSDEPIAFSTESGKEYIFPDSLEEAYPPWLSEKEALEKENCYLVIDGQQFFWPVMSLQDKFLAVLQHD
nr:nucleoprotein [Sudan ebolavirus]